MSITDEAGTEVKSDVHESMAEDKFWAAREVAEGVANSHRASDGSHTPVSKALFLMIDLAGIASGEVEAARQEEEWEEVQS